MTGRTDASYRLKVAAGFLEEARQDVSLSRWRSAVDNGQLTVEKAAKAVASLAGPIGRTHNAAGLLRQALKEGHFPPDRRAVIEQLVDYSELLGPDVHVRTDSGDESKGRTPWDLFGESDARDALDIAENAFRIAQSLTRS